MRKDRLEHLLDRRSRDNLKRRGPTKTRFDSLDEAKNFGDLTRLLSVRVVRSSRQSLDDQLSRRAKQDDVIELAIELALIGVGPAHEEHRGVFCRKQLLNTVLTPEPNPSLVAT